MASFIIKTKDTHSKSFFDDNTRVYNYIIYNNNNNTGPKPLLHRKETSEED